MVVEAARQMFLAVTKQYCIGPEDAFGDDLSDMPMLEAVDHPVAVSGDPRPFTVAAERGRKILHSAENRNRQVQRYSVAFRA
jgi:phosphoserine phosphatase